MQNAIQTIDTDSKIAFIGLGVMGRGMALNLMAAGFSLSVYTRTKSSAQEVLDAGGKWCDTPQEAVRGSSAVITIVGYPQDVEDLYLGEGGILAGTVAGAIVIDMTTSSPQLAEKIAAAAKEKGIYALDAPVSGGDIGAKNGTLSIMVGGEEAAFTAAKPLFEAMGKNIVYHGKPGSGQHCKASNQIAIAASMLGVCEALKYAEKSGLDLKQVLQSIESGAAGSWSLTNLGPRIINGDFEPGFFVKHIVKDIGIALDSAERLGCITRGLPAAQKVYQEIEKGGDGEKGTQVLFNYC